MKTLISIVLLAFISTPSFAKDAEFPIRWSLNHEPINYFDKVAKTFQKNIEVRSKGRVKVYMERESILEANILQSVVKNDFQLGHVHTQFLETLNPEFEVFQLPFLFDSDDHLTLFSKSEAGHKLFASLEAKGIHAVDYTYSGGQIGIYGPKIKSMADLKAQTFNVENGNENYISFLKKMGIDAQQLQGDLPTYDALAKKQITYGEAIPWVMGKVMTNSSLKNVHFNQSRHRIVTRVMIISSQFLKGLPEDLRKIVVEETELLSKRERQIAIEDIRQVSKKFASKTKNLNVWTAEQRANDKKMFEPFYQQFISKYGSGLVDAIEAMNPERQKNKVAELAQ